MTLVLLHLQVYQSLFLTDSQVTGQSLAFSLRHARNCMVTKLLALISEILQISSWVIAFDPLFEWNGCPHDDIEIARPSHGLLSSLR